MAKGIIFDLDGTLISEREYILGCLKHAGSYIERIYGTKDAYENLKNLFEVKWERIFNRYLEQEKITHDEAVIKNLIQIYRETDPEVVLYSDVVETLERLRSQGVMLTLLTNGYREVQKRKIEKSKLKQFFDLIVIPDEYGREYWKPNTWGYDMILHKLAKKPEEMLAVGDMDHDISVPKKLGMTDIYIEREDRLKDLSPDILPNRIIHSLRQIEMEV